MIFEVLRILGTKKIECALHSVLFGSKIQNTNFVIENIGPSYCSRSQLLTKFTGQPSISLEST